TLNEHGPKTDFPSTACAVSGCKPTTFPQFNNTFFNLFFDFFTTPSEHTGLQGFMNGKNSIGVHKGQEWHPHMACGI
ncbi:MAG: hypothetical protein ACJAUO_001676, partial [Sediminicola sp.]